MNMQVDKYQVRQLELDLDKVELLWNRMSEFRMLFSDLTMGDKDNFVQFVTQPYAMFFEVVDDVGALEGVVCFTGMQAVVDVDAHIMFFNRKPGGLIEKIPVMRAIGDYMFDNFPLHRITVVTPKVFFATIRLLKRLGFTAEGDKREATIINGRWLNLSIFGVTREEWYVGTSRTHAGTESHSD